MLDPHSSMQVKRTCSRGRWKLPLGVQGGEGPSPGTAQWDNSHQRGTRQPAEAPLMATQWADQLSWFWFQREKLEIILFLNQTAEANTQTIVLQFYFINNKVDK